MVSPETVCDPVYLRRDQIAVLISNSDGLLEVHYVVPVFASLGVLLG
jgi:hypothetical protein